MDQALIIHAAAFLFDGRRHRNGWLAQRWYICCRRLEIRKAQSELGFSLSSRLQQERSLTEEDGSFGALKEGTSFGSFLIDSGWEVHSVPFPKNKPRAHCQPSACTLLCKLM